MTRNMVVERWELISDWVRNRGSSKIEWKKSTKQNLGAPLEKMDKECHLHPDDLQELRSKSHFVGRKIRLKNSKLPCMSCFDWPVRSPNNCNCWSTITVIPPYRTYTPHFRFNNSGTSRSMSIFEHISDLWVDAVECQGQVMAFLVFLIIIGVHFGPRRCRRGVAIWGVFIVEVQQ